MTDENTLTIFNSIHFDLKIIKELVYDKCGFNLTNLRQNFDSLEYRACSFQLNEKKIQYRMSKITPTKSGQFVSIWKRNKDGITYPFDSADNFDFVIITSRKDEKLGQFIFPKSLLADKGIITRNKKIGKRGIRVYPPWDITTNKQAMITQSWQTKYFLKIENDNSTNLEFTKILLAQ